MLVDVYSSHGNCNSATVGGTLDACHLMLGFLISALCKCHALATPFLNLRLFAVCLEAHVKELKNRMRPWQDSRGASNPSKAWKSNYDG